jgi:hypothetical protein
LGKGPPLSLTTRSPPVSFATSTSNGWMCGSAPDFQDLIERRLCHLGEPREPALRDNVADAVGTGLRAQRQPDFL